MFLQGSNGLPSIAFLRSVVGLSDVGKIGDGDLALYRRDHHLMDRANCLASKCPVELTSEAHGPPATSRRWYHLPSMKARHADGSPGAMNRYLILSQKVCAGRIRTNAPTPGYNIQSLFRILPQHTVALRCAKSLELPQNGFLRGNHTWDSMAQSHRSSSWPLGRTNERRRLRT